MKSILYFLLSTSIIITSCKSDNQAVVNNKRTESKATNNNGAEPIFTMVEKEKTKPSIEILVADTIEVNSIEDMVANANHNTAIKLKKGSYKLSDQFVYYISEDKKEIIDKRKVETRSIGGQIYVSEMTNFSIFGNGSEILSNNPKAVPLYILKAEQGEVKNLTLGHNIPKNKASSVPSLYVARSYKVNFYNCNLGNNSQAGLKILNSKFLTFTNCNINNAQEKVLEFIQAKSIQYINSSFKDNTCTRGCFDFLGNENSIEFKYVDVKSNKFIGEKSNGPKQMITGQNENIRFRNSKFQGNKNFDQIGIDDFNLTECEVQKF